MVDIRLELWGDELRCSEQSAGTAVRRLAAGTLDQVKDWAGRYDRAVRADQADALLAIGSAIAQFLDSGDRWLERCLGGAGDIATEVIVRDGSTGEPGRALLEVPWELLAPGGVHLAADGQRLFRVVRRLGQPGTPLPPRHRDLALVFMAADVEGERVLNYEQEEQAILEATRQLDLNLIVEESGCLEFLDPCLMDNQPEALHLSCHGDIVKGEPVLALETPEGRRQLAGVADLRRALGEAGRRPALVFLSACRSAEHAGDAAAAGAFTQALIRAGIDNALGWDGSVSDADAIRFARDFYGQLAGGKSVGHAAAEARQAMLLAHFADPERKVGRHWHLARVYAGAAGGGPLCDRSKPKRPFGKNRGYTEFLDKAKSRVPVASAAEFVGRRRQAQQVLAQFRDGTVAGVLIHGMGSLGKSSLAARIANRRPRHKTVVLYDRYHALAVFDELIEALPPRLRQPIRDAWLTTIQSDEAMLKEALQELLEGPFRCADPETKAQPILLIIDDLEQILEDPQPGEAATPVKTAFAPVLAAVIAAFRAAGETESRLLLTSRYTFQLTDARGDDLAGRLATVALPPMDKVQQDKQLRAARALAAAPAAGAPPPDPAAQAALEQRIKGAAQGNPGLQAILSQPLLAGEPAAAERAVAAVEKYLKSGQVPTEESAAITFFKRVSLDAYRRMLTPTEAALLRAATLFSLPVPREVLVAAGKASAIAEPGKALDRLEGLGLVDRYVSAAATEAMINPLARPLVPPLTDADRVLLAKAAVPVLWEEWKEEDGTLASGPRAVELAELALAAGAPAEVVNAAATGGGWFLFGVEHAAGRALDLVTRAADALDRQVAAPALELLRLGAACAERLGEADAQERFLARGLAADGGEPQARAMLLVARASRLMTRGNLEEAKHDLMTAVEAFERLGDVRSRAVTMGKIADILQARGQLDEALRIRQEEELPVYERLGDVRSRAVTMGQIADILQARGQLDEALRIRQEEELPVYERLGDVRSRAVTMGKIADILQARGQLDEALRIRQEEELPVYERLGDVRSRAVTMGKIADILQARGQLDEALRIRQEEELPVYERLGDVRSRAVTMGKIADILQARGQLDEALRIRQEEQLPVYERLGDVRERAVTMGKIADILQARGQLDEALRIRQEEELPVYERLGDVRSRAVTMGKIADILQARGQLDEALRIRQEEELPVYERLGDVRSRAVTMGKIADILQARGQLDEALRIRQEEELPVYERLGDVRSLLVGRANLAITLLTRNNDGDRPEANRLLCLALTDARRLRLPEAAQIKRLLGDVGLTCD